MILTPRGNTSTVQVTCLKQENRSINSGTEHMFKIWNNEVDFRTNNQKADAKVEASL